MFHLSNLLNKVGKPTSISPSPQFLRGTVPLYAPPQRCFAVNYLLHKKSPAGISYRRFLFSLLFIRFPFFILLGPSDHNSGCPESKSNLVCPVDLSGYRQYELWHRYNSYIPREHPSHLYGYNHVMPAVITGQTLPLEGCSCLVQTLPQNVQKFRPVLLLPHDSHTVHKTVPSEAAIFQRDSDDRFL